MNIFVVIKWSFCSGLYFSVSSLSTGGLYGIPETSPDWMFAFVGAYACTGVPVMGMAMGDIAGLMFESNEKARINAAIKSSSGTHLLENKIMEALDLDEGDRTLDKHEFLLATLVRLHIIDVDLVQQIFDRFDELNVTKSGLLTYDELMAASAGDTNPLHSMTKISVTTTTAESTCFSAPSTPITPKLTMVSQTPSSSNLFPKVMTSNKQTRLERRNSVEILKQSEPFPFEDCNL